MVVVVVVIVLVASILSHSYNHAIFVQSTSSPFPPPMTDHSTGRIPECNSVHHRNPLMSSDPLQSQNCFVRVICDPIWRLVYDHRPLESERDEENCDVHKTVQLDQ